MASRIVTVPFVYEAEVVPPRARKPRTVAVRDEVGVIVRDLSSDDFPLAARVRDSMDGMRYAQTEDVRWDGFQLYRPYMTDVVGSRDHVDASVLEDIDQRVRHGNPFGWVNGRDHYREEPLGPNDLAGQILKNGHNAMIADIRRVAASLVVHQGMLWYASGEPCYRFVHGGWASGNHFNVTFQNPRSPDAPETLVRADRFDAHVAATYPGREEPFDVYGEIEILMPETLRLSVEGPALVEVAKRVEKTISSHVHLGSVAEFAAYAALRDALETCGGHPTEDLLYGVDQVLATPRWLRDTSHIDLGDKREAFRAEFQHDEPGPPSFGR